MTRGRGRAAAAAAVSSGPPDACDFYSVYHGHAPEHVRAVHAALVGRAEAEGRSRREPVIWLLGDSTLDNKRGDGMRGHCGGRIDAATSSTPRPPPRPPVHRRDTATDTGSSRLSTSAASTPLLCARKSGAPSRRGGLPRRRLPGEAAPRSVGPPHLAASATWLGTATTCLRPQRTTPQPSARLWPCVAQWRSRRAPIGEQGC